MHPPAENCSAKRLARFRRARFRRLSVESLENRTLLAAITGVGTGLVANYYSDTALANLVSTKTDEVIDYHFGAGVPDNVPSTTFSIRWSGKVQAQYSEPYTFYTEADQPVRRWVNGVQLVNDWSAHTLA